MTKVLHVFNSTIVSGPETLVIPALRGLREHGIDAQVTILTESRRAAESARVVAYARGLGLVTHDVPVRSRVDRDAIDTLARLIAATCPAIVHSHDVKASTYTLKAARKLGKGKAPRIVSTHHGVRGRSGLRSKLYERFYARFVLPGFDRVLAVCTSDRGLLVARGLPMERTLAHRNGVDRPRVDESARERESARLRAEWRLEERGVRPGDLVVGFVGRIAPEKRIDRILKVASLVDRDDWKLVIFGTGPLEAELKAQARALGLGSKAVWMGYRAGVGAELAGLDALIAMSDAEGLPINLVEAGWAATPVLATAVDGILDLVPDPDHGTLVDVSADDAAFARELSELLSSAERRRRIGRNFQARVEREFSGRRWVADLAGIYRGLVPFSAAFLPNAAKMEGGTPS